MRAFMLVVACDGVGCAEALSLCDTEAIGDQLRGAGCSRAERVKHPFPRALVVNR